MEEMYNQLIVGIYYYIDDEGKKFFDIEKMRSDFENKINELLKTE
jgi:hypothetical protein